MTGNESLAPWKFTKPLAEESVNGRIEHGFNDLAFDVLKLGFNRQRSQLYERIERRCEFYDRRRV